MSRAGTSEDDKIKKKKKKVILGMRFLTDLGCKAVSIDSLICLSAMGTALPGCMPSWATMH